jgi:CDP-diacylglycerol--serine O-phosphatidyltransferase
MKLHLPNALTCCNLFSGCIAAVMIFRNHLNYAAYFVFISAFFDLLDGMAARKIAGNSAFGKELDSLADAVSFGFVPGAVMFKMLQLSNPGTYIDSEILVRVIQFLPFIITVFSVLRLAKFNLDTRQTNSFIGLPTPACTLFIVSLPLILKEFPGKFDSLLLNPFFIIILSILLSYLLIAEIPLFSMKFKTTGIQENIYQYILLIAALIFFPFFLFAAIPIIITLYILLSIIQNKFKPKT